jgi:hypothetical protein
LDALLGVGKTAQHLSAHLLLNRSEVFRCQRASLGATALPAFARGEHPVDHAVLEVDMGIQRAAKALGEAPPCRPLAQRLQSRSQPSMTRKRMCGTALSASGPRCRK